MTRVHFQQRGVVIVSVLMILVLLSTLVIYTVERQDLSIRRVMNLRQAEESFQIATGGEQWAVKLLEKDLSVDLQSGGINYDHLQESWANLGGAVKVEGTEALMLLNINDEQGKFNLNNLTQGIPGPPAEGQPQTTSWYLLFQRLLINLQLDPLLANVIIDWVDADSNTTGTTGAEDLHYQGLDLPYRSGNKPLLSLAELQLLRDFTPEVIRTLQPHVTALPIAEGGGFTKINVNTASAELLAAMAENGSTEDLQALVEYRLQAPFESVPQFLDNFSAFVPKNILPGVNGLIDIHSDFFMGYSCAESGRVKLSQSSLLKKVRNQKNVKVLYRQRHYGCADLTGPS